MPPVSTWPRSIADAGPMKVLPVTMSPTTVVPGSWASTDLSSIGVAQNCRCHSPAKVDIKADGVPPTDQVPETGHVVTARANQPAPLPDLLKSTSDSSCASCVPLPLTELGSCDPSLAQHIGQVTEVRGYERAIQPAAPGVQRRRQRNVEGFELQMSLKVLNHPSAALGIVT